jgi:hypothetical protein
MPNSSPVVAIDLPKFDAAFDHENASAVRLQKLPYNNKPTLFSSNEHP